MGFPNLFPSLQTTPNSTGYERWIQCANCLDWYHCNCVRIYDEKTIKQYRCESCCAKQGNHAENGECKLKRITSKKRVQIGTTAFVEQLKKRTFAKPIEGTDIFILKNGKDLEAHLKQNGFFTPIVLENMEKLDMKIPANFSVENLMEHFGSEYPVEVLDSYRQTRREMTVQEFLGLLNSFELSETDLWSKVESPQAIRSYSWTEEAYKHPELQEHCPTVEK